MKKYLFIGGSNEKILIYSCVHHKNSPCDFRYLYDV